MKAVLERRLQLLLPTASLQVTALPLTPLLRLYLLAAQFRHVSYSAQDSAAIMDNPPYWSFCWASGQVLAAHILACPEWVRGRSVVDFGAGSGVVAIAARLAGARRVTACDLDADARLACTLNAALNGVQVNVCGALAELDEDIDLLLAADVLYDLENRPLLYQFPSYAEQVIIADSRAKEVAPTRYRQIAEGHAVTLPDYGEFDEFKQVKVYRNDTGLGT